MTHTSVSSVSKEAVKSAKILLEDVRLRLALQLDPNLGPWKKNSSSTPPKEALSPKHLSWLTAHPDDESEELAALLTEAAPRLGLSHIKQPATTKVLPRRPSYTEVAHSKHSLKERVKCAVPAPIVPPLLDWSRLVACISSEMVKLEDSSPAAGAAALQSPLLPSRQSNANSEMLEINSGGRVLFCLFAPLPDTPRPPRALGPLKQPASAALKQQPGEQAGPQMEPEPKTPPHHHAPYPQYASGGSDLESEWDGGIEAHWTGQEQCVVVKFLPSRLLTQSEQFANELTRHVGICAPETRILRQHGPAESQAEWQAALKAAELIKDGFPDLHEEMTRCSCMLVMEFIPGKALFRARDAWERENLEQTMEDLGRLMTLDMLLGNSDRLPCEDLGWRGNLENVMFASSGRWGNRLVAIDAMVQRRPPGGLLSAEDAACERLAELALNDRSVARSVLCEAVSCSRVARAAADSDEKVEAFQRGLKAALNATMTIKGLLEMMFEVISEWIEGFLSDIEECHNITPGSSRPSSSRRASGAGAAARSSEWDPNTTFKIRMISHEAQHDQTVSEKVVHWKGMLREKGEELRRAVVEWQMKRAGSRPWLTTGFLDGTSPVVDAYELKVRLEHMLQRLRVLQDAASTAKPTKVLSTGERERIYVSGAVEANSHHLLRHLGVTHILNATEDLLLPETSEGFECMRVPLRDVVEEDISQYFRPACDFINDAMSRGGCVLVHCHGGRSRSVSLVLAWLMVKKRWTLRRALGWVSEKRPEAAPNAGYMAALLRLEEQLFGQQTVKVKRTKPELKVCPMCEEKVGLSAESVRVHMRQKHQTESEGSSPVGSPTLQSPTFNVRRVLQPSRLSLKDGSASPPAPDNSSSTLSSC